jgi:hypothetical protein
MNAACTPNGAAMRFVPGSGIILQSCVLPPTFARPGRQCLPPVSPRRAARGGASLCPHPINSTLWFCAPYGSSQSWWRAHFPPQAPNEKTPPRGPTARRGVVSPRRKRGSASTRPTCGHAFIKGGGCRFDSRLWNPEIALTTLMSGHAVSHVGQAGGSHLSSTFCAAAPATSNQDG